MRATSLPLLALLLVPMLPGTAADHLDDGTYRCDGGWCEDGRERVLQCGSDGCMGDVGGFTTIRDPVFGDGAWLSDDDWIIGISVQGAAKAYPVRIISGQQGWELVTDEVGGFPVVVTYCPLCGSPIAYSRVLDGQVLSFLNTGAIWRFDLVMFDEQTGSQWSQVSGEALDGDHHGRELELVPHEVARWDDWRARHPDGRAMDIPRSPDGDALCTCPPVRLGPASMVTGVVLGDRAYAFPHTELARQEVAVLDTPGGGVVGAWSNGTVHVYEAAGRSFTPDGAAWMRDGDGVRYHRATGEREDGGAGLAWLETRTLFGSRWDSFFPDTTYLTPRGSAQEPPGEEAPLSSWVAPGAVAGTAVVAVFRRTRRS